METWFVTDQYVEKLLESNHEEAETHMVLYARYKNTNAVVVSKDTGCDTRSYLYGVGKIKVFKKCANSKEKLNLLQDVVVPSTINEKTVDKVSKFIQTTYPGMKDESVTETRVRIYKLLKTKTLQPIPPDENSMLQPIKRIRYHLYYTLISDIVVIPDFDLSENGWMTVKRQCSVSLVCW